MTNNNTVRENRTSLGTTIWIVIPILIKYAVITKNDIRQQIVPTDMIIHLPFVTLSLIYHIQWIRFSVAWHRASAGMDLPATLTNDMYHFQPTK